MTTHAEAIRLALDALELVKDCSSQEWQQADGKRMAATDNQGRKFWFITQDTMEFVSSALAALKALPQEVELLTNDELRRAKHDWWATMPPESRGEFDAYLQRAAAAKWGLKVKEPT